MASHVVIAFPELSAAGMKWLEDHRKFVGRVTRPHFTFVFPCAVDPDALVAHVETRASTHRAFAFAARCVMAMPEANGTSTIFLVPDEGTSAFVRLHADLYTGMLAPELRTDLPFVPHITMEMIERAAARPRVDELNRVLTEITGTIAALEIVALDAQITTVRRIELRSH